MHIPWNTITLLVILVGIVLLQIFLSRRESRWPGLVLPSLTFLLSLCVTLGGALFLYIPTQDSTLGAVILPTLLLFLMYNIPTLVLLGIYFACREKYSRKWCCWASTSPVGRSTAGKNSWTR